MTTKHQPPLRLGIIGCGGIMRGAHLPGWKSAGNIEIVAACDSNPDTLARFAAEFGIAHTTTDYRELATRTDIDVIDIATPNRLHTPAALAALNSGKHVLCEKPLATTTAEVRALAAAALKADRLLMTAQHMRWTPMGVACRRWVEAGNLGQVYHARIHALRRNWLPGAPTFIDDSLSGGGPCMDIGVHALDLGMWLMGNPTPVRVSGTTRVNFAKGDRIPGAWGEWDRDRFTVEDFASGFVHFDNGATMVIESSWLQHQKEREDFSAQLFGDQASLHWPSGEFQTAVNRVLVDGRLDQVEGLPPAHSGEIHAFVDAIRNGKPSPVPVAETLKVISILEAIVESGKTGREVRLDHSAGKSLGATP